MKRSVLLFLSTFVFLALIGQKNTPAMWVGGDIQGCCGTFNRGIGYGAGLQVGRHDLFGFYQYHHDYSNGGGINYKYYLAAPGIKFQPYFNLIWTGNDIYPFGGVSYPDTSINYGAKSYGLYASIGNRINLWRGLSFNFGFGMGLASFHTDEGQKSGIFPDWHYNMSLRYYFQVAGPKVKANEIAREKHSMFRVSARFAFDQARVFASIQQGPSLTIFPTLDLAVSKVWHPYIGIEIAMIDSAFNERGADYFTPTGITCGLKIYTFSKKRWSFYHDIGYVYSRVPAFKHYNSRLVTGNVFSLHFKRGISAFGGFYFAWMGQDASNFSLGLSVAPATFFADTRPK